MAPALMAAKAKATARRGRIAVGPRTDEKDWGLLIGKNCKPMAEDSMQREEKRESTRGWERTFSGAARAPRNGMTDPRLTTSATPPASIKTDRRANCFLRREDSLDQRCLRVLLIWELVTGD